MAPQDDNSDHQAHSPLIGGSMVTTFIKGSDGKYGVGTLGFFASINNVPKYKNIVLVSNVHVLGDHGGAAGDAVYQPSWTQTDGNWLENFKSNPVGVLRDLPVSRITPINTRRTHRTLLCRTGWIVRPRCWTSAFRRRATRIAE